jgi:hypothetical protein
MSPIQFANLRNNQNHFADENGLSASRKQKQQIKLTTEHKRALN